MKMNRLIVAALTSLLAFGIAAPAFAAGDRGHDRGRHGWDDRGRDRGQVKHRRDDRRHYNTGYRQGYRDARQQRNYHRPAPRVVYHKAPPYGWARGHRYRDHYRGPVYVVHNYGHYHLRQPPHGHHWIRDDRGNLLLVAIATGIIADLVLNGG